MKTKKLVLWHKLSFPEMKKCVLFFALFVVAVIVFKISSVDNDNKSLVELASITKDTKVAKK